MTFTLIFFKTTLNCSLGSKDKQENRASEVHQIIEKLTRFLRLSWEFPHKIQTWFYPLPSRDRKQLIPAQVKIQEDVSEVKWVQHVLRIYIFSVHLHIFSQLTVSGRHSPSMSSLLPSCWVTTCAPSQLQLPILNKFIKGVKLNMESSKWRFIQYSHIERRENEISELLRSLLGVMKWD